MTQTYMRCSQEIWIYFGGGINMDEFIIIPDFILEDKELNHAQKILFWVIWKLMNKEKKCYSSYEDLGKILNSDDRTSRRNLDILSEKWYIEYVIDKNVKKWQKCQNWKESLELVKNRKCIIFWQKCHSYIYNIYSLYNNSSSKKKINIKKEEREKMLEAFRNDDRLTRYENEDDVIRWWDHKQTSKKPYKDVNSFMRAMVKIKNTIKYYWDTLKSDRDIRNRFNYAVNEAIERDWEWLNWYDSMEQVYESSKDDLYPNPKQNE